jgi:hypothetical protein
MRHLSPVRLASLLLLSLLAACEGGPPPASLPLPAISASFPPHGLADVILIDATDPLPLRRAELIAPNGKVTMADWIDVTPQPGFYGGQNTDDNPMHGDVGALTLPDPIAPGIRSEGRLLTTISRAQISLPEPVAYRRDWQNCRIRLEFGTPPGRIERRQIPAPEPTPTSG